MDTQNSSLEFQKLSPDSPLKVLIVDDDELDRMLVRRALGKASRPIDMYEADGFDAATSQLANEQFDCLIFDYRLGDQDGIELIQKIQTESLSQAPIVMLSGVDNETVMLNSLKEGAQDYLLKSEITTSSLVRAIRYAQERKQISRQLRFLAQHDTLTGLANRTLFIDSVKRAIARANRHAGVFAVIFIDIDNFKSVNDTLGHEAGDQLLTITAQRIQCAIRGEDMMGRLGGDEFSILIQGMAQDADLINIADKILKAVREPVHLSQKTVYTTVSLGLATFPKCADEATSLIKCADLAMYKAKQSGRNDYCFYSADLQHLANQYANTKIDLHRALERQEFELYYQPQIRVSDGTIVGFEALIRWHHPEHGIVVPDQFIPVAESTGLINAIGEWVIGRACQQLSTWSKNNTTEKYALTMAINMSAHQIRQEHSYDKIAEVLAHYQLPHHLLELELTESTVIDDIERCRKKLQTMSEKGINVAIDDFGTGFSSFQHLQQLPLQKLKIDKSFINDLCTVQNKQEIVKAIIIMAHALGLLVVAEGVETQEQAQLLKSLNCDQLQGYYFSEPKPASVINDYIDNPSCLPSF